MGENKHTPAEDPDRLVKSLVERAGIARSEGNATATADAWHFEQAAAEITRLRAENDGMREALAFYGDPAGWNQPPVETVESPIGVAFRNQASKVQKDRGQTARSAISPATTPDTTGGEA